MGLIHTSLQREASAPTSGNSFRFFGASCRMWQGGREGEGGHIGNWRLGMGMGMVWYKTCTKHSNLAKRGKIRPLAEQFTAEIDPVVDCLFVVRGALRGQIGLLQMMRLFSSHSAW
jgi:hypothetical protein